MLTMMMSIVHRITGVGLYFGTLLLAWWLIAAASGPNAYAKCGSFMSSLFGRLILFGYTWALIHHMLGGIRHLIWDTGRGFEPNERESLRSATLVGSIALTVMLWIVGYLVIGGGAMSGDVKIAHAARARARPRRGAFRHRAFLAAARDGGRQRAAHHRLRRHRGLAARAQSCGGGADPRLAAGRDHDAAVHRHRSPITCGSACR